MSLLRRCFAPLSAEEWSEVDGVARSVLEENLVARRFVDVRGPHGWDYSSYNLGRLGESHTQGASTWSLRKVQPLIELRIPFALSRTELDNLGRGAPEVALESVVTAAQEAARFEEHALYNGLEAAGISGLTQSPAHAPIALPKEPGAMIKSVTSAMMVLSANGVEGPYLLVLGETPFQTFASSADGYPVFTQLEDLLGTRPAFSRGIDGGLLVSMRGGDFVLSLGGDHSVGFAHADADTVHLFLTESFTFDVPGPEAAVVLQRRADA